MEQKKRGRSNQSVKIPTRKKRDERRENPLTGRPRDFNRGASFRNHNRKKVSRLNRMRHKKENHPDRCHPTSASHPIKGPHPRLAKNTQNPQFPLTKPHKKRVVSKKKWGKHGPTRLGRILSRICLGKSRVNQ